MNREETTALCRYTKACCPQQAIDEYTPDAWYDLLGKLEFADCREAVRAVASRQPFVAPAEIRAEVRRLRTGRLEGFQYVPVEGDNDVHVYLAAYRAQRAAVASGLREAAPAALPSSAEQADAVTELASVAFLVPRDAEGPSE